MSYAIIRNEKLTRVEVQGAYITWTCKKFDIGAEDYLIRDF